MWLFTSGKWKVQGDLSHQIEVRSIDDGIVMAGCS